jgi:hypothetical protein
MGESRAVHRCKREGKRPFGRPGINGIIILRWIFRKWKVRAWSESMWLRIETGGEHL